MSRALVVIFSLCLLVCACTQRMVCPAYQSAFIYDKNELRKKFSYFQNDSTPKVFTASKTKYLIAEPVSYKKKIRSLQTVEIKPIYVNVPDSLKGVSDSVSLADLDKAARSVIDSTVVVDLPPKPDSVAVPAEDSVYVISRDKELRLLKYDADSMRYKVVDVKLNIDQDNYMWYLRDKIVLPDVRLLKIHEKYKDEVSKTKEVKKERRGIKGFFKDLFSKKKKQEIDSASLPKPAQPGDEFNLTLADTAQAQAPVEEEESDKKKTKTKKKKVKVAKKKEAVLPDDEEETTEEQPAEKEEEEDDDGF